jgi:hypothetical protein
MSTSTIMHHPAPYAVSTLAVAAVVAATVVLTMSGDPGTSGLPSDQPQQGTSQPHVWHPTTAGGHVMVGE